MSEDLQALAEAFFGSRGLLKGGRPHFKCALSKRALKNEHTCILSYKRQHYMNVVTAYKRLYTKVFYPFSVFLDKNNPYPLR